MTFFCPCCFAEIDPAAVCCLLCGADIEGWRAQPCGERLIHALGHPLSEVRMGAIEALGRCGHADAALALVQCALAHPLDVVQGMAVLRALAGLPRDESWGVAVALLAGHPVQAVARDAAQWLVRTGEAGVDSKAVAADAEEISRIGDSIDDFANHTEATERIIALGDRAIMPLRRYLAAGPQVIPQGRLFAVAMLARLHSATAHEVLREVLHGTPLCELPGTRRDAEYVVRDSVIRSLVARAAYPEQAADVAYAVRQERLPSAVVKVGELGLSGLAPVLVDMLEDDVVERVAGHSLEVLGVAGQSAVLHALPALFERASSSVRGRLAVIRALLVLYRLKASLPAWTVRRAREDPHPAIRAAAALFASSPSRERTTDLIHGALSDDAALAEVCRERLAEPGPDFVTVALQVLQRDLEPDIYGNRRRLPKEAARWLARQILKKAPDADVRGRVEHFLAQSSLPGG